MCVCVCDNKHMYLFICGCRCFVWLISCGSDTISSVKKAIHHFGADCGETPLPLWSPATGCIALPADLISLIYVIYICVYACIFLFNVFVFVIVFVFWSVDSIGFWRSPLTGVMVIYLSVI